MNCYHYRAVDTQGQIHSGRVHAEDPEALERQLRQQGLELLQAHRRRGLPMRGIPRRELITLCFHLEQNFRAGVPLLEGLQDLRDSVASARLRQLYGRLIEQIGNGKTLSAAMQDIPETFDPLFINLVRAGEHSGDLGTVARELGRTLKWRDEQLTQLRRSLGYPLFVLLLITAVVGFLMAYLVPEMARFMASMNQTLPLHTRLLFFCAGTVAGLWHWMLATGVLGAGLFAAGYRYSPALRLWLDERLLQLPVLGELFRKLILARISIFLAMMYSAGITIIDCLTNSVPLSGNRAMAQAMQAVQRQVCAGACLSDGFRSSRHFPSLFVRLVQIGERTGTLEDALRNISYFYSRDVRETSARLQSMIEPCMTLTLGALMAWILFSILGPIYDLIATIQL